VLVTDLAWPLDHLFDRAAEEEVLHILQTERCDAGQVRDTKRIHAAQVSEYRHPDEGNPVPSEKSRRQNQRKLDNPAPGRQLIGRKDERRNQGHRNHDNQRRAGQIGGDGGLANEHRAQVQNYLKATGFQLGILANFGHYPKLQTERIVNTRGRYRQDP
jgi:hypothetical protein